MATYAVPRAAMLDAWSDADWSNGIQIDKMEELETLAIRTMNSIYEITILDGRRGDVLVRGGKFFPTWTPTHMAGCTFGGSILKMRGIYVGMKIEFNHRRRRITTSPVQTIGIVI